MGDKPIKHILLLLLLTIFLPNSYSQPISKDDTLFLPKKEIDGEEMPVINMRSIYVLPSKQYDNFWTKWRYRRLIRNLKIVYPYAQMAKKKFEEMNREYQQLDSKRARKKYMNQMEKELMDEFGQDMRKMTISQGKLLLKLIDREIGNTSYAILKEYKGSFSAFFWQSIARLFGSNLKSEYDPDGKDRVIERLIFMYEKGML